MEKFFEELRELGKRVLEQTLCDASCLPILATEARSRESIDALLGDVPKRLTLKWRIATQIENKKAVLRSRTA